MGQYVVKLEGGGEMRVNASSQAAANNNAQSTGAVVQQQPGPVTGVQSGGIGSLTAADGKTLGTMPANVQQQYRQQYGNNAEQAWVKDHNASIGASEYMSVVPQAGSGSAPGVVGAPGVVAPGNQTVTNPAANKALTDAAQQAAYQAYLNSKLNLDTDDLAFRKATQAFTNTMSAAALTGTYEGQQTQAAQSQQFNQQQAAAKQTADIAAQQAATGLARDSLTQKTSQDYLTLLSQQRGPQDYGQYLKTLGSTPQGLRDLVGSAAGLYQPATGATTGVAGTPASMGGLLGSATTGMSGGQTYADYMQQANGLVAPNQIAPAAMNAYTDTQKKLLLGMYEATGWNPADVTDLYKQSLPKYTYGAGTTGTVKLA